MHGLGTQAGRQVDSSGGVASHRHHLHEYNNFGCGCWCVRMFRAYPTACQAPPLAATLPPGPGAAGCQPTLGTSGSGRNTRRLPPCACTPLSTTTTRASRARARPALLVSRQPRAVGYGMCQPCPYAHTMPTPPWPGGGAAPAAPRQPRHRAQRAGECLTRTCHSLAHARTNGLRPPSHTRPPPGTRPVWCCDACHAMARLRPLHTYAPRQQAKCQVPVMHRMAGGQRGGKA